VDAASVRSFAPTIGVEAETESILGEVMGDHEKSLLRSLGHRFADKESESMFPPDPSFAEAFEHEFDDIDDMAADGSNEGQNLVLYLGIVLELICRTRISNATVARETEALSDPLLGRETHL
jgi:hypothetical protein